MGRFRVAVVVPAFNESKTIGERSEQYHNMQYLLLLTMALQIILKRKQSQRAQWL